MPLPARRRIAKQRDVAGIGFVNAKGADETNFVFRCAFTPRGAGRPSRGDTRMKFKSAANAVLSGVKMEKAAAGECVKVRLASARPLADLPLHSFLPSRRSPLERPVWSPGRGAMPPAVRQGDQGGP